MTITQSPESLVPRVRHLLACGAVLLTALALRAQTIITDDFSTAANWEVIADTPPTSSATISGGRLNYLTASTANGAGGMLLKDVRLTLDRDWSTQVDVHIASFTTHTNGQFVDFFLSLVKTGDIMNTHLIWGYEYGYWGSAPRYSLDEDVVVNGVAGPNLFESPVVTSPDVTVRLDFDTETKTISYLLDPDGSSGPAGWQTFGSTSIVSGTHNLALGPGDTLSVGLLGSSEYQAAADGAAWVDNFRLTISDPPTDVAMYMLNKARDYEQTGASTLTVPATGAWEFECSVQPGMTGGILSGTVTFPAPVSATRTLIYDGEEDWDVPHVRIDSQAQLDDALPAGDYVFSVVTAHSGTLNKTITYPADAAYPDPVTILNYAALQSITVSVPLTVEWTAWTAGTDNDAFSIWIEDGQTGDLVFENSPLASESGGTATSITIPAGTLQPGRTYRLTVQPMKVHQPAARAIPPGTAVVLSSTRTDLTIHTRATGPSISQQPITRNVGVGDAIVLSVQATGTGQLRYQWRHNGADISGATGASLSIPSVSLGDLGYYSVVATDDIGSTTSSTALVRLGQAYIADSAASEVGISGSFDGTAALVGISGDTSGAAAVTAQRVLPNGVLTGSRILTGRTGGAPWLAFDGTNHLMVWDDTGTPGAVRLYGSFVTPAGALVGSPFVFPVAGGASSTQRPQGIAFNGTEYLVVYLDGTGSPYRLCARTVSTTGVVGNEVVIATNAQSSLQSVASAAGKFLVAWPARLGDSINGVQGCIISAGGSATPVFTISETNSPSYNPLCVSTNGSEFLVVFNHDTGAGYPAETVWELRGRIVTTAGTFPSHEFTIADAASDPVAPAAGFDGARYLVTWTGKLHGDDLDILARYVTPIGAMDGGAIDLVPGTGNRAFSSVTRDGSNLLVTFNEGASFSYPLTAESVRGVFVPMSSPLSITAHPQSKTIVSHEVTYFDVGVSGVGTPHYRWQYLPADKSAWSDISDIGFYWGSGTSRLYLNGITTFFSGAGFRCAVSTDNGPTLYSEIAYLTINRAAVTLTLHGLTQVYDGTPKSVEVTSDSQWVMPSVVYPGGSVPPSAVGSYLVSASVDNDDFVGSVAGTLTIQPAVTLAGNASVTTAAGGATVLAVSANAGTATTYQWQLQQSAGMRAAGIGRAAADAGWVDIPGATNASYTISSSQAFHGGNYRVLVTANGVTATSDTFVLQVSAPPPSTARVMNLSTRALDLTGDNLLIPGFVISGTGTKRILVRAVGPGLHDTFGLQGYLADPQLTLRNQDTGTEIAANDDWGTSADKAAIITTSQSVGAFPLLESSKDSVLVVNLPAGHYTAPAVGAAGGTGIAMVELYDADPDNTAGARLVNISNRGFVDVGDKIMIPGFVVSNEGSRTFLIRAVGPGLRSTFGLQGILEDPVLTVFNSAGQAILSNDNWDGIAGSNTTSTVSGQVGAFPLVSGSTDAAFVVTLPPGGYTIQATGKAGSTGVALVEVYLVP